MVINYNNKHIKLGENMILFKRFQLNRLRKKVGILCQERLSNEVPDAAVQKEIVLYKKIGRIYDAMYRSKKFPYVREMAIESYRLAADLGDVHSIRTVGERLLEFGKFWESMEGTLYYNDVHAVYKRQYFDEAFLYLNTANDLDDVISKRLLGLSYINAWGVEADVDRGLTYVIESLDLEDAWPRSSAIFAELGLDKPEFFKKIMSLKRG